MPGKLRLRHRRVGRMLAVITLIGYLSGCYSWRASQNQALAPEDVGKSVRLSRMDSTTVVLDHTVVSGDSIAGELIENGRTHTRLAVPLSDIKQTEVHQVNPAKTTAAVLGVGAAAAGVAMLVGLIIFAATWDGPFGGCCQ